jgi:polyhydroxyalkanoate synthesis repressor PhaR
MSKLRTIKKYSNRRLYDLQVKRYVTLDEIYDWVVAGADIHVIDKDSQEDITCAVLFQVITAHEHRLHPSLNVNFLWQAIRDSAGGSMGALPLFLDLSLKCFLSDPMQHLVRAAAGEDPTQTAERLATENHARWCSAQSDIHRVLATEACTDSSTEEKVARPGVPVVLDGFDSGPRRSARQPAVTGSTATSRSEGSS